MGAPHRSWVSRWGLAGVYYYPGLAPADTAAELPCIGSEANVPIGALPYDQAARTHELTESLAKITPGGERPTLDAYSDALERELSANAASGARVLVLVSGGPPTLGPNCTTPESNQTEALAQPLLARIEAARRSGIRTLVVGDHEAVPDDDGSAFRQLLSTAAALGGTASEGCGTEGPIFCHVDLSAAGGETLNEALTRVVPNIDVCALSLPVELRGAAFAFKLVFSPTKGEKEYYIVESRAANANCQLGYWLDDSTIRLCQNTCAKVRSDPFASVSVEVRCSTLLPGSP